MIVRVACVAAVLTFSGSAHAQNTKFVTMRTCPERPAPNDPSITLQALTTWHDCTGGVPRGYIVRDRQFGYTAEVIHKSNKPPVIKVISPAVRDVYETHEPCRIIYKDEHGNLLGWFMEWNQPRGGKCDGLPSGASYREYFPDDTVCIRPIGGCMKVGGLAQTAKDRFGQTLYVAYTAPTQ